MSVKLLTKHHLEFLSLHVNIIYATLLEISCHGSYDDHIQLSGVKEDRCLKGNFGNWLWLVDSLKKFTPNNPLRIAFFEYNLITRQAVGRLTMNN